jgi:hypothetical protein
MEILIAMAVLFSLFMATALFSFLSPVTSMSCHCVPIFHIEQFGGIFPQFVFSSIPWFSSWPSFSEISFQNLFWNSDVHCPYYISSRL